MFVALRYSRNPGLTWSRKPLTVSLVIHARSSLLISDCAIRSSTRWVYANASAWALFIRCAKSLVVEVAVGPGLFGNVFTTTPRHTPHRIAAALAPDRRHR